MTGRDGTEMIRSADFIRRATTHHIEQGTSAMQLPVTIDPRYHDAVIFGLEGVVMMSAPSFGLLAFLW